MAATSASTSAPTWLVSSRLRPRLAWSVGAVVLFAAAAGAAVWDAVRAPSVPTVVLAAILGSLLVMAVVLAAEAVASGILRVDQAGYRMLGRRRSWSEVLAIGTGRIEGRDAAVVVVRHDEPEVVAQEAFAGFTEEETDRVVATLRDRAGALPGFTEVVVPESWWQGVEAEADRAASVVQASCGREPVRRERVAFGFPGLVDAVLLDYGVTEAGEEVALYVRDGLDLGLVAHGRRWLRQTKRRSVDPATQVGLLFGPHEASIVAGEDGGFDRLIVEVPDRRRLVFNAEEPDRF